MSRCLFIEAQCLPYQGRQPCQVLEVPPRLFKVFGIHKGRNGTCRLQVALRQGGHRMGHHYLRAVGACARSNSRAALRARPILLTGCTPNRLLNQPKTTWVN